MCCLVGKGLKSGRQDWQRYLHAPVSCTVNYYHYMASLLGEKILLLREKREKREEHLKQD